MACRDGPRHRERSQGGKVSLMNERASADRNIVAVSVLLRRRAHWHFP